MMTTVLVPLFERLEVRLELDLILGLTVPIFHVWEWHIGICDIFTGWTHFIRFPQFKWSEEFHLIPPSFPSCFGSHISPVSIPSQLIQPNFSNTFSSRCLFFPLFSWSIFYPMCLSVLCSHLCPLLDQSRDRATPSPADQAANQTQLDFHIFEKSAKFAIVAITQKIWNLFTRTIRCWASHTPAFVHGFRIFEYGTKLIVIPLTTLTAPLAYRLVSNQNCSYNSRARIFFFFFISLTLLVTIFLWSFFWRSPLSFAFCVKKTANSLDNIRSVASLAGGRGRRCTRALFWGFWVGWSGRIPLGF